jgi:hypothetical protein
VLAGLQWLHMGEIKELHDRITRLEAKATVTVHLTARDLAFPEQIVAGLEQIEHRR